MVRVIWPKNWLKCFLKKSQEIWFSSSIWNLLRCEFTYEKYKEKRKIVVNFKWTSCTYRKNTDDQYYKEFCCRQYCLWARDGSPHPENLSLEIWKYTNFRQVSWTFFWIWVIIKGLFFNLDVSLVDLSLLSFRT